jgi:hypothetical protein
VVDVDTIYSFGFSIAIERKSGKHNYSAVTKLFKGIQLDSGFIIVRLLFTVLAKSCGYDPIVCLRSLLALNETLPGSCSASCLWSLWQPDSDLHWTLLSGQPLGYGAALVNKLMPIVHEKSMVSQFRHFNLWLAWSMHYRP